MKYIKTFEEINIEEINIIDLHHNNLSYSESLKIMKIENNILQYIKDNNFLLYVKYNLDMNKYFGKTLINKLIKYAKRQNDNTLINLLSELLNMHKEIEFNHDIKNFNL